MGRIVVTEFISLDGVMEGPGGERGYRHAGWTFEFDRGQDGEEFKLQEARDAQALLLGRVTYEGFAAAWPQMQGEFADRFNSMPKYVVSATLADGSWANTTVLRGDVADEVARLRDSADGDLYVHGSCTLVQSLLQHDLVDRLHLMRFPVVLGTGRRLFGETPDKLRLTLAETRAVGSDGVEVSVYERSRA